MVAAFLLPSTGAGLAAPSAPAARVCLSGASRAVRADRAAVLRRAAEETPVAGDVAPPPEDTASAFDVAPEEQEIDLSTVEPSETWINAVSVYEAGQKYKLHEKDTGSPEVQIARLSAKIKYLTDHAVANKKDNSSTRGLLAMVARRKKLLKYLKSESPERHDTIVSTLKIRIAKTPA